VTAQQTERGILQEAAVAARHERDPRRRWLLLSILALVENILRKVGENALLPDRQIKPPPPLPVTRTDLQQIVRCIQPEDDLTRWQVGMKLIIQAALLERTGCITDAIQWLGGSPCRQVLHAHLLRELRIPHGYGRPDLTPKATEFDELYQKLIS